MRARELLLGVVVMLLGCRKSPAGQGHSDAPPEPASSGRPTAARLLDIENRRVIAGVTDEDIASRDVRTRRLAARALARIGHPRGVPLLLQALSDEDGEVMSWAAHGLSYVCRTEGVNGVDIARALTVRAATLPALAEGGLDAAFSITRGLGRCASVEAERTLVTWLGEKGPRAGYAALALGDVASRRKELEDATHSALLEAAASRDGGGPLAEALYPFGRLDAVPEPVRERLLGAAKGALRIPGPLRIFAVRSLSRVNTREAASELSRILEKGDAYTVVERAEAARGLGRLRLPDEAQQKALLDALPSLVPPRDPVSTTTLGTEMFGPLSATLEALRAPLHQPGSERILYELARWQVPKDAPLTLARRVVRMRCRAASLLVDGVADDPLLLQCDPDAEGASGQRAQAEVIGRRPIVGRRLALYRKLLASPHLRVREAAVDLLGAHPEIEDTPAIVAAALVAKEIGMVATAAEFVTKHPERVAATPRGRDARLEGSPEASDLRPDVAKSLREAIARRWAPDDVETLGSVVEAAGAAHLTGIADQLETFCQDGNPTLREHAARALSLIKARVACPAPPEAKQGAPELGHLVASPVKLELTTDAGVLTMILDPAHAPVTVTRVADLVREGFYDGIVVHRVVPGFVVQFGDPGADGYGGPGREPLRCETTPAPYGAFDVGVALAGRDTGSSQLFVTVARYPNLDQEYALIGKADGNWNAVAEGDIIRKVRVVP